MRYNGTFNLATGVSARSKKWKNTEYTWSDFAAKIKKGHKTHETYDEFMAATKPEQSKIKDVGGYVGGYLTKGVRKPTHVLHRQLLTLDIDFGTLDLWSDLCIEFDHAMILHGTHKHSEKTPRFRLLVPINREVTADEYVAIARKLAGQIGIELFDKTTFETNRLMFWPSTPTDCKYYYKFQDGMWLDADRYLSMYTDWTDSSEWPTSQTVVNDVKSATTKQEDPEIKRGIIGAFCRTYTIQAAIAKFLREEYTEVSEDRYTYKKGSAAAGLIVYEDKFAYSHHGTDPISGQLCNAFDLCRIHLFGHLDSEQAKVLKSVKAMEKMASEDKDVRILINREAKESAMYDFGVSESEIEDIEPAEEDWVSKLEIDTRGKYVASASNINLILSNDAGLRGLFRLNTFNHKTYLFGNTPWRKVDNPPELVRDVDLSGLRNYVETIYGIAAKSKIEDALALEYERNSYNPVKEYLDSLKWDGVERVDTLLIDYLGAEDNDYSREAIRKTLVGAVARIYQPGIKFDLVLTLVGSQGTGKSTFFRKLGMDWFSDSFSTVLGKEAFEQIQGVWLVEMAELAGLRKAEVEAVKHFISKQDDTFRPAYGRVTATFPRQCVFLGTTNNITFLRDATGNRRFLPIDVKPEHANKSILYSNELEESVNQIWAEAIHLYKAGEKLYLSAKVESIAREEQRIHSEEDCRRGLIESYLNKPIPVDWDKMDLNQRRLFLDGDPLSERNKLVYRDHVCAAEIWCEALGREKKDMTNYSTREINNLMKTFDDWDPIKGGKRFSFYGTQRGYKKNFRYDDLL